MCRKAWVNVKISVDDKNLPIAVIVSEIYNAMMTYWTLCTPSGYRNCKCHFIKPYEIELPIIINSTENGKKKIIQFHMVCCQCKLLLRYNEATPFSAWWHIIQALLNAPILFSLASILYQRCNIVLANQTRYLQYVCVLSGRHTLMRCYFQWRTLK